MSVSLSIILVGVSGRCTLARCGHFFYRFRMLFYIILSFRVGGCQRYGEFSDAFQKVYLIFTKMLDQTES